MTCCLGQSFMFLNFGRTFLQKQPSCLPPDWIVFALPIGFASIVCCSRKPSIQPGSIGSFFPVYPYVVQTFASVWLRRLLETGLLLTDDWGSSDILHDRWPSGGPASNGVLESTTPKPVACLFRGQDHSNRLEVPRSLTRFQHPCFGDASNTQTPPDRAARRGFSPGRARWWCRWG